MGDEIPRRHFNAEDFSVFRFRLDEETKLLAEQFRLVPFQRAGGHRRFRTGSLAGGPPGRPAAQEPRVSRTAGQPAGRTGTGQLQRRTERQPHRAGGQHLLPPGRRAGGNLGRLPGHGQGDGLPPGDRRHTADHPGSAAEFGSHVEDGALPGTERPGDGAQGRQAAAPRDRGGSGSGHAAPRRDAGSRGDIVSDSPAVQARERGAGFQRDHGPLPPPWSPSQPTRQPCSAGCCGTRRAYRSSSRLWMWAPTTRSGSVSVPGSPSNPCWKFSWKTSSNTPSCSLMSATVLRTSTPTYAFTTAPSGAGTGR